MPTDYPVGVTMHTLVYGDHGENDKNNDITSPKVTTGAPWSHSGPFEDNLEPGYMLSAIQ